MTVYTDCSIRVFRSDLSYHVNLLDLLLLISMLLRADIHHSPLFKLQTKLVVYHHDEVRSN